MIKKESDITKTLKNFNFFAQVGDINHAMDAIIVLSQKTLITPNAVLDQIIEAAIENEGYKEYDMACQILMLMENTQAQYKSKSTEIEAVVDDAKYCLDESKKSGNSAVIKNYIAEIHKNLAQVESIL